MTLLFHYKLLIVRDEEKYKLNLRKYDPHSRFVIKKVVVVITLTQMSVFGAQSCFYKRGRTKLGNSIKIIKRQFCNKG